MAGSRSEERKTFDACDKVFSRGESPVIFPEITAAPGDSAPLAKDLRIAFITWRKISAIRFMWFRLVLTIRNPWSFAPV